MESPTYYLWPIWYRSIEYLDDIFRGRRIKWFIQRRRRGFDERELWGLDYTIAKYVYPRIKAFNKFSKVSIAPCFFADPEKIDHSDEEWEVAKNNQKDAYDKMEQSFFYIVNDVVNDDEDWKIDTGIDFDKYPDFKEAYQNIDNNKWKLYKEEMDRRTKVIEEGLEVFAKYFRTLWD